MRLCAGELGVKEPVVLVWVLLFGVGRAALAGRRCVGAPTGAFVYRSIDKLQMKCVRRRRTASMYCTSWASGISEPREARASTSLVLPTFRPGTSMSFVW